jgi:hypothetical protein
MFSPDIVDSDAFLDMPQTSQLLYFHLAMRADDDGFVSPKKIMRMLGTSNDDLKVLLAKRFLLEFDSGVVVIKHWLIHNLIRADLYKETLYKNEKSLIGLNDNGAYTEMRKGVAEIKPVEAPKWLQIRRKGVNKKRTASVPKTALRLGKDRLGKDTNTTASSLGTEISEIIDAFKVVNPAYQRWFSNTTQRSSCQRLIETHTKETVLKVIAILNQSNLMKFAPNIQTPLQLEEKWSSLETFLKKVKEEKKTNVAFI